MSTCDVMAYGLRTPPYQESPTSKKRPRSTPSSPVRNGAGSPMKGKLSFQSAPSTPVKSLDNRITTSPSLANSSLVQRIHFDAIPASQGRPRSDSANSQYSCNGIMPSASYEQALSNQLTSFTIRNKIPDLNEYLCLCLPLLTPQEAQEIADRINDYEGTNSSPVIPLLDLASERYPKLSIFLEDQNTFIDDGVTIGEGASKTAYQAILLSQDGEIRPVIKLTPKSKEPTKEQLANSDFSPKKNAENRTRQLTHEMKLQKSFDHPHIVKVEGVLTYTSEGLEQVNAYVESCDSSLEEAIRTIPLFSESGEIDFVEFKKRKKILNDALSAVSYLHVIKEYVHNDLKPGNILLSKEEGKLTDFGICVPIGQQLSILDSYMFAPEQKKQKAVEGVATCTVESNIFALGLLLWQSFHPNAEELLSSFDADRENREKFFTPLLEGEKDFFSHPLWQKEPLSPIQEMVKRCLDRDPSKRPSLEDIQNLLSEPTFLS